MLHENKICFEPLAFLTDNQGVVMTLVTREGRLYSDSTDSNIRIRDLLTVECILTFIGHM